MKINIPKATLIKAIGESKGCIVAIPIPKKIANKIKIPGEVPVEEMHITVVYLESGQDINFITELMKKFSEKMEKGIELEIGGVGRFQKEDKDVIYASVNSFGLEKLRTAILKELDDFEIGYSKEHGFTAHISLAYVDRDDDTPTLPEKALTSWVVDFIEIWHNDTRISL